MCMFSTPPWVAAVGCCCGHTPNSAGSSAQVYKGVRLRLHVRMNGGMVPESLPERTMLSLQAPSLTRRPSRPDASTTRWRPSTVCPPTLPKSRCVCFVWLCIVGPLLLLSVAAAALLLLLLWLVAAATAIAAAIAAAANHALLRFMRSCALHHIHTHTHSRPHFQSQSLVVVRAWCVRACPPSCAAARSQVPAGLLCRVGHRWHERCTAVQVRHA